MNSTFTKSELKQLMDEAGIRPSLQRLAVLEYLAGCHHHPSADEIYATLIESYPTLSRTTVFNTLRVFVEKGLVNDVDITAEMTRYDFARRTPHAHFQCRRCRRIFDIPFDMAALAAPEGYACDNVNLYFKGLCPDCYKSTD